MRKVWRSKRMRLLVVAVAFGAFWAAGMPGLALANVTLSHVDVNGDGVPDYDVYTNDQATYYVARHCMSSFADNLLPAGQTASVGPGYIFRVDFAGNQVIVPQPATHPQSGLGVFAADVYRGTSDGATADDFNTSNGYGAVWGNICRTPNGSQSQIWSTQGRGVVDTGDTLTTAGTDTSTTTGYLWVHYVVNLGDQQGTLFRVEYDYRFYSAIVRLWTNVTECPTGSCGGTTAYVKMPKFASIATGPHVNYTQVACYDQNGTNDPPLKVASNIVDPKSSTSGNHCNDGANPRDEIIFSGSTTYPNKNLKTIGRSYPTNPFTAGNTNWAQWEGVGMGLDQWAAQQNNPLPQDDGSQCPKYSGITTWYSGDGTARDWEMGGDDGRYASTDGSLFPSVYGFFKGWEDGVGYNSCHSLFDLMDTPGTQFANFFSYRIET